MASSEHDLKVFIEGTEHYFSYVTGASATLDTPFLKHDDMDEGVYDFSAVIGVSGSQRGMVYYSAPRSMVREILAGLGEIQQDDAILADYVGEIANTISGNARAELGSRFMISPPVVFYGDAKGRVHFPKETPAFVIPMVWKGHRSSLIICLERDEAASEDATDFDAVEDATEPEDIG